MRNKDLNMETVLSPAFLKIWENSLMGVMIIDRNGVYQYMNRLLIRTDDLHDVDIIGTKMVDLYPVERDCHLSLQTLETGKPIIKKTIVYYTRKKKLVNSLCSSFPLRSKGRLEGVIHFSLNLQTSQNLLERYQNQTDSPPRLAQKKQPHTFDSLIGKDHRFQHAVTQAKSASQTRFNVFIWAETGCGKELFAQAIHQASARAAAPFIPINCAAIPDNLLEATLFGTAKGAFTGAVEKPGLLEQAQGGTILLDELNSMSLELQAKLLRVIQEKRVRRVGALKEHTVDLAFISTSNIPPSQALDTDKIRTDLFYRLAVVVLEIPPLRQRKPDIPLLCAHFLEQLSADKLPYTLSPEVFDIFDNYPWPGNVRELEHTLKAGTAMLGNSGMIEAEHLSDYFMTNYKNTLAGRNNTLAPLAAEPAFAQDTPCLPPFDLPVQGSMDLAKTLQSIESLYIQKALARAGFNISKAGRYLNLSPQALGYKIKRLGIRVPVE